MSGIGELNKACSREVPVDGIYDIKHICVVPEDHSEPIIYVSGLTSNFFNHYIL